MIILPMAGQVSQPQLQVVIDKSTTSTLHNHGYFSILVIQKSIISILTKFHAGYFRISLSLGGQALLWKTIIGQTKDENTIIKLLQTLHPKAFFVLWFFAFFILIILSLLYTLRCLFYFKLVKEEFFHHVGVNYLFAPWISWLLLLQSAPSVAPKTISYLVLWWVFALPIFALDIKIYGEWFTKGKRLLSKVANPTSQMSVIGNLMGAQAAAHMGWKESAMFLFSIGMVHYVVVCVTLYQRLSGGNKLPAMLRPSFFLFFAAPSMASLAWESISGSFDTPSKMFFFLSLFFFSCLICRPARFKSSMRRFNVAWWAYSFPLTVLALASVEYAQKVGGNIPDVLMLFLLAISFMVSLGLSLLTIINSKMLLPDNDPIASLLYYLPTAR